jgi:hypothetical protein
VDFTPSPFTVVERALRRRLGGPQSLSERYGEEKHLCLLRELNSASPVVQRIA